MHPISVYWTDIVNWILCYGHADVSESDQEFFNVYNPSKIDWSLKDTLHRTFSSIRVSLLYFSFFRTNLQKYELCFSNVAETIRII